MPAPLTVTVLPETVAGPLTTENVTAPEESEVMPALKGAEPTVCSAMGLIASAGLIAAVITISATVVEWVRLPVVPVMVTVAGPTVAVLEAVKVSVLVVVVLAGLNDAVTPAGRPLAVRPTELVKPLRSVTATVLVPLAPCTTLTGASDRE